MVDTASRVLYEEERERRRELKVECKALEDRVLILEARLAVSERQNTPSSSSSASNPSPVRGTEGAADDVDSIEDSIRRLFERNQFLETKVKQLEGELLEKKKQQSSSSFEKEFRVGRKMLQVSEEIEATLSAEVGRLRQVVKAQRHAIQRLVSDPGAALEPGEYSRLTSHASPPRQAQSSRAGRRQPAATFSAAAVAANLRTASSSSRTNGGIGHWRPMVHQQRSGHATAPHGGLGGNAQLTRLRVSDRMTAKARRGQESSDLFDLLGRNGPGGSGASPDVFLDISDGSSDDSDDCEDGDALPQCEFGSSPARKGPSRSSSSAGSPSRVVAWASSAQSGSPHQARNPTPSIAAASSSSSRAVEHSAPWTPTRGKELIPNIVDFGMLNLAPALVDPNYENRVHAAAEESRDRDGKVTTTPTSPRSPSKHKQKTQTPPLPRRSPGGSPASKRLGSPAARPVRKTPPSRKAASKISQALQIEVDRILQEIEASLRE